MTRPVPYNGQEPFIFVSYSHKDKDIVWPIISHMINDGYRVWYDDGINPGTEWDEFIASKISECGYLFAFISENYLNSDNCKDEINYARDHVDNKLLIYLTDVELSKGMEMRLGRVQAIFKYTFAQEEDFYKKLAVSNNIDQFINKNTIKINTGKKDNKETKPEKTRKKLNVKDLIFYILMAVISVISILGICYFADDYNFYKDKFNGQNMATKSTVYIAICSLIIIAAITISIVKAKGKRHKDG